MLFIIVIIIYISICAYDSRFRHSYVEFPPFHRSGYYDWRVVSMANDFCLTPVSANLQGRFIVHPPMRSEVMHEVWVELEGAQWDWSGKRVKHGDFKTLANAIDSCVPIYAIVTLLLHWW